jgi:hypothetical protein
MYAEAFEASNDAAASTYNTCVGNIRALDDIMDTLSGWDSDTHSAVQMEGAGSRLADIHLF